MSRTVLVEADWMELSAEFNCGNMFLHLWMDSPVKLSNYKEFKNSLPAIREAIKRAGYKEVFSLILKDDETALKFQEIMGMVPLAEFYDSVMFRQEL